MSTGDNRYTKRSAVLGATLSHVGNKRYYNGALCTTDRKKLLRRTAFLDNACRVLLKSYQGRSGKTAVQPEYLPLSSQSIHLHMKVGNNKKIGASLLPPFSRTTTCSRPTRAALPPCGCPRSAHGDQNDPSRGSADACPPSCGCDRQPPGYSRRHRCCRPRRTRRSRCGTRWMARRRPTTRSTGRATSIPSGTSSPRDERRRPPRRQTPPRGPPRPPPARRRMRLRRRLRGCGYAHDRGVRSQRCALQVNREFSLDTVRQTG